MAVGTDNRVTPWAPSSLVERAEAWMVARRGYGLRDGGCLIFAKALSGTINGARIATVLRNGRPDHHGVILPDGRWADADGIYSSGTVWANEFRRREILPEVSILRVVPRLIASQEIPSSEEDAEILSKLVLGLRAKTARAM